jgi:hypothetical protein
MPLSWRLAAVMLGACALFASAHSVRAQAVQGVSTAQQVQQLAPQLLAFAGSAANFESLANGLSAGTPVSLTTVGPDGIARTVTFTPPGGLSPLQVAQTLEAARQQLVIQGIGAPTAEQISATLLGGLLATPSGTRSVAGLLPQASTGTPAAAQGILTVQQVQQLAPQLLSFSGSSANFQSLVNGLSLGTPVTLTTPGTDGLARSVTFTPAGGLSAQQIAQTLEIARQQLITQGIVAPTGEQIGVALLGASSATPGTGGVGSRASQPSINTSASPFFGTSDSPVVGTSASRTIGTSNSPVLPNPSTQAQPGVPADGAGAAVLGAGAAVGATVPRPGAAGAGATAASAPNGPPSPAAQIQGRR